MVALARGERGAAGSSLATVGEACGRSRPLANTALEVLKADYTAWRAFAASALVVCVLAFWHFYLGARARAGVIFPPLGSSFSIHFYY